MSWAYLNAEGKQHWGDIFPDGKVPIHSIITIPAKLKGIRPTQNVYMVDWKKLTTEQQLAIREKLRKLSGASKEDILKDILEFGLPLREKYTDCSGKSRVELFF